MQEEIHDVDRLDVWKLVPPPDCAMIIGLKWIYKVKLDEYSDVLKNKARLVAKGYRQEEGLDLRNPLPRLPVLKLSDLHCQCCQQKHDDRPNHVHRLKKALYSLKQAPRVLYDTLSKFLLAQGFSKGLQISLNPRGIFINQSKYANEILKKFDLLKSDHVDTLMVERTKLDKDLSGIPVDKTRYQGMVGCLMYLIASRPDLVFAVCMCARYQSKPAKKHLEAVKRVFRYLQGTINMGLWYPKYTTMALPHTQMQIMQVVKTHEEAHLEVLSSLVINYGFAYNYVPLYCDNKIAIALCCNNVQHSRSKHIDIQHHFIREQVENGVFELYFVRTEYQLAYIFTKAFPRERFEFILPRLGMKCMKPKTLKRLQDDKDE
ncbi:retrovirus-related pol polyprotein from transposon TNT 1-94 [Tanacetum coccineum]